MDIAESQCVTGSNNEADRYQSQLVVHVTVFLLFFLLSVLWPNGYRMKLTASTLLFDIVLVIHEGQSRSFTTALESPRRLLQVKSHSYFTTTVQVAACQSQ